MKKNDLHDKSKKTMPLWTLILWLLSFVYRFFDSLNKKMYLWNLRKSYEITVPVISIGNLTVGGSGKTPFIIFLTKWLQSKNYRVGIVSKNYKAECRGIHKIDLSSKSPSYFGDEPSLIHVRTQAVGYVGPKKYLVAKEIIRNEKLDCLLIDDGFQHHALRKTLNILLMDVTQWQFPAKIFPLGRYREGFSELKRADIICWTRTNLVSSSELLQMKKKIRELGFLGADFEFSYETNRYLDITSGEVKKLTELPKKILLFCGIARPESLLFAIEKKLQNDGASCQVETFFLSDHQNYDEELLKKIINYQVNHRFFLTTEKDFIKIRDLWPNQKALGVLLLDVDLKQPQEENKFYEVITQYLHKQ